MKQIMVLKQSTHENHQKLFRALKDDYEIIFCTEKDEGYQKQLDEVEVIIGEPPLEDVLKARHLKWLQMTWAGTDLYTRKEGFPRQVCLTNMSGVYGETISEYVIGAILTLYRRFPQYLRNQKEKLWKDMGSEKTLPGKVVLIIGAGDIGTCIAKRLRPFGTYTVGIRRVPRQMESCFDNMYTLKELDYILPQADVVISCLPSTSQTEALFDYHRFRIMKKDALFVNVGRGNLVRTKDLIQILQEGHLFGAALDVMEEEPLPKESKLWDMENVLLTPHISGQGYGHDIRTENKIYDILSENIRRYEEGLPLLNRVDIKEGYREIQQ